MDVPDGRGRLFSGQSPLVVNGVMYFSGGEGTAFAIDAKTGRQLLAVQYPLPPSQERLRQRDGQSRAVDSGTARLHGSAERAGVVALDIRTGKLVWEAEMADYTQRLWSHRGHPLS